MTNAAVRMTLARMDNLVMLAWKYDGGVRVQEGVADLCEQNRRKRTATGSFARPV